MDFNDILRYLPRSHTHWVISPIRPTQELLSDRSDIIPSTGRLLLLLLATHPGDAGVKFVHGFLELAVCLLIVFHNLLIPPAILQLHATSFLSGLAYGQGPSARYLLVGILFVEVVLEALPVGKTMDYVGGAVKEAEGPAGLGLIWWKEMGSEVRERFEEVEECLSYPIVGVVGRSVSAKGER